MERKRIKKRGYLKDFQKKKKTYAGEDIKMGSKQADAHTEM